MSSNIDVCLYVRNGVVSLVYKMSKENAIKLQFNVDNYQFKNNKIVTKMNGIVKTIASIQTFSANWDMDIVYTVSKSNHAQFILDLNRLIGYCSRYGLYHLRKDTNYYLNDLNNFKPSNYYSSICKLISKVKMYKVNGVLFNNDDVYIILTTGAMVSLKLGFICYEDEVEIYKTKDMILEMTRLQYALMSATLIR